MLLANRNQITHSKILILSMEIICHITELNSLIKELLIRRNITMLLIKGIKMTQDESDLQM